MAKSDELTDFETILAKDNVGPLFDTVYDALAAAKTPEEARVALELYTKAEIDAALALKANASTAVTVNDLDQALDGKLDRDGGVMISQLTLPGSPPTDPNHATRKGYVDTEVNAVSSGGVMANPGIWHDFKMDLRIQWGVASGISGAITFPIAFPANVFVVLAQPIWDPAGANAAVMTQVFGLANNGFSYANRVISNGGTVSPADVYVNWIALGN